jgi:ribosomal protein L1
VITRIFTLYPRRTGYSQHTDEILMRCFIDMRNEEEEIQQDTALPARTQKYAEVAIYCNSSITRCASNSCPSSSNSLKFE